MLKTITEYETSIQLLYSELHELRGSVGSLAPGDLLYRLHKQIACLQHTLDIGETMLRGQNMFYLDMLVSLAQDTLDGARALSAQTVEPKLAA